MATYKDRVVKSVTHYCRLLNKILQIRRQSVVPGYQNQIILHFSSVLCYYFIIAKGEVRMLQFTALI